MVNKEVIPAFDLLLEELSSIIPELKRQNSQFIEEKRYQEAGSTSGYFQSGSCGIVYNQGTGTKR